MGLLAAKYADFVIILEYNTHFRSALIAYAENNGLKNTQFLRSEADLKAEVLFFVFKF